MSGLGFLANLMTGSSMEVHRSSSYQKHAQSSKVLGPDECGRVLTEVHGPASG